MTIMDSCRDVILQISPRQNIIILVVCRDEIIQDFKSKRQDVKDIQLYRYKGIEYKAEGRGEKVEFSSMTSSVIPIGIKYL